MFVGVTFRDWWLTLIGAVAVVGFGVVIVFFGEAL